MFKKIVLLTIALLLNSAFAQETITREQRCQTAQQNLERLSDISKPIYGRASDGSVRELTYQEILNARQKNQDLVNSLCSVSIQPSLNPQYETRAAVFTANSNTGIWRLRNKLKGQAQVLSGSQDSISVSLRNALLRMDWGEVEIILRYVIGIDEPTTFQFVEFAKTVSANFALEEFNNLYYEKGLNNFRKPKSGISGKEGATDISSWVREEGYRPRNDETDDEFAERALRGHYREARNPNDPKQMKELRQLKKWASRFFEKPTKLKK